MTTCEVQGRLLRSDNEYNAENCRTFDALLHITLARLYCLRTVEREWRSAVANGSGPFDPDVDRLIVQEYREWLRQARSRLRQLEIQESDGCRPPAAAEFRQALEDVEHKVSLRARADLGSEARRVLDASGD